MAKLYGFTYVEAVVSVAILAIISTITVASLSSSTRTDELNNAAQVLTADLRSLQSQALSASSIKACTNSFAKNITCVLSTAGCVGACTAQTPSGVGMHLAVNQTGYDYFAELEPSTADWKWTSADETFFTRSLAGAGGPNVVISAISAGSPVDVAFERQNGTMVINGCRITQGCTSLLTLNITLKQTQTGATKMVSLNAFTGRISIN